jgi:DnaK suppressor protein
VKKTVEVSKPAAPVQPPVPPPSVPAATLPPPGLAGAGVPGAAAMGENRPKPTGGIGNKSMKRPKPVKKPVVMPSLGPPLADTFKRKGPLIQSGPKAPDPDAMMKRAAAEDGKVKPVFNRKELDKWKLILIRKRAELLGDVEAMEGEALQSSGSLSHMPQHIAEQGSEAYEQEQTLRLAQADRNLIREIDEALKRVEEGSYGICELLKKPISKERLEELPWTRFSIEAAREMERRGQRV